MIKFFVFLLLFLAFPIGVVAQTATGVEISALVGGIRHVGYENPQFGAHGALHYRTTGATRLFVSVPASITNAKKFFESRGQQLQAGLDIGLRRNWFFGGAGLEFSRHVAGSYTKQGATPVLFVGLAHNDTILVSARINTGDSTFNNTRQFIGRLEFRNTLSGKWYWVASGDIGVLHFRPTLTGQRLTGQKFVIRFGIGRKL